MKKTKRRSKKESLPKIQRKLWIITRNLCRKLYGNDCYTCGRKNLEGQDWHIGHMIPRSVCGAYLKYDIRQLRPQDSRCNIWGGGMGAEFLRNMIIREGQSYVDAIYADRNKTVNPREHFLFLTESYKLKLEELG